MTASRFHALLGTFLLAAVLLGSTATAVSPQATRSRAEARLPEVKSEEVRALWVQRASITSPDQISRLVRDARASGFNTLLVQVRGRGDAYFTQGLEPRPATLANQPATFDPLAQALTEAHAAGLRVHAWVNVNLIASVNLPPADRGHVMHRHPEWLMVPRALAPDLLTRSAHDPVYVARLSAWTRAHANAVEGLFTSPIPMDAARYVEAVITDLVERYPVDGVHLDYIRYPTADFDYSALALAAFRDSVQNDLTAPERTRLDARLAREPLIYTSAFPERWQLFRRTRLTDLVARIRVAVKHARPNVMLTAAVKPDVRDAFESRLQDWQDWASRGLLDAICPMAYTPDLGRFTLAVQGAARAAFGEPVALATGQQAPTVASAH